MHLCSCTCLLLQATKLSTDVFMHNDMLHLCDSVSEDTTSLMARAGASRQRHFNACRERLNYMLTHFEKPAQHRRTDFAAAHRVCWVVGGVYSCSMSFCGAPKTWPCTYKYIKRMRAALPRGHFTIYISYRGRSATTQPFDVRHIRRTSRSVHTCAEQLVLTGDTPVGQGLLSSQTCQSQAPLLELPLNEVVAISEPHLSEFQPTLKVLAATAAYSRMPQKLLDFVQGRFEHLVPSQEM